MLEPPRRLTENCTSCVVGFNTPIILALLVVVWVPPGTRAQAPVSGTHLSGHTPQARPFYVTRDGKGRPVDGLLA